MEVPRHTLSDELIDGAVDVLVDATESLKELGVIRRRYQGVTAETYGPTGNLVHGKVTFAVDIESPKYTRRGQIFVDVPVQDGKVLPPLTFRDNFDNGWPLNPKSVVESWGKDYGIYTWTMI